MSTPELTSAKLFVLPRALAEDCYEAMRVHGETGAELFIALSAVFDKSGEQVHFRRALIPEQTCHKTHEGLLVTIDGDAIFALNRDCYEEGEILAGQMHSHPRQAYHSRADDELALVKLPGGLSIVVPDFATGPLRPRRWSVSQLQSDGGWKRRPRRVKLKLT